MSMAAGTMVTANVRLVRPLGQGGMGSVWVGHHAGLDTEVAVKFIAADAARDEQTRAELVQRFKREASAAAKIKSPHVVQMLDHGVMTDGTPYMVMELLEGESLGQRLARVGRLRAEEAVEVITQISKALTEAHALGVIHRDQKPDNVFLTVTAGGELVVKVLDFGIARQEQGVANSALTGTSMLLGTPQYMSPEQLTKPREVDARADLWALAVVAYEAITGRLPFVGETVAAVVMEVGASRFPPPSTLGVGLPNQLDGWFARAFAADIGKRFQTAKELSASLRAALGFSGVVSGDWPAPRASLPSVPTVPSDPVRGQTQIGSPDASGATPITVFGAPSGPGAQTPVPGTPTFDGAAKTLRVRRKGGGRVVLAVGGAVAAIALVAGMVLLGGGDQQADTANVTDKPESAREHPASSDVPTTTDDDAVEPAAEASAEPAPSGDATSSSEPASSGEPDEVEPSPTSKPAAKSVEPTPAPAPGKPAVKPRKKKRTKRKQRLGF